MVGRYVVNIIPAPPGQDNNGESRWRPTRVSPGAETRQLVVSLVSGVRQVDDESKSRDQLIRELAETRQRLAELQPLEDVCEELRKSEMRYRSLADNVSDVIWAMDLDLAFTYYSPSVAQLRGYTAEQAMAKTLQETLTPASYRVLVDALEEEMSMEIGETRNRPGTRTLELEEYCDDGSTVWVEVKISFLRDEAGRPMEILGVTRNITQRKETEATIKQLAFFDQVTGLPNRVLFKDRLSMAVLSAARNKDGLALMMVDLDRFKNVNDTFGHAVGDQLLRGVGDRLRNLLRSSDTVSRIGGDEYMILLPGISDLGDVAIVANKITAAFQEPFIVRAQRLSVTASIGVGVYPEHGTTAEALIEHADMAMYRAKALGRNIWQWSPASHEAPEIMSR
jgi:diguanylate cyclase (GGDEF)-like protein/PAS domain S-box-containing protein